MPDEPSSAKTERTSTLSILSTLGSKLLDNLGSLMVVGIISIATIFWNDIRSSFDAHILDTVSYDLKQGNKSTLFESIRDSINDDVSTGKGLLYETLSHVYQGNINKIYGEVTFGTLELSDFNAEQEIKVFVPPSHQGVIRMQVDNLPAGIGVHVLTRVGTWGFVCNSAPVFFDVKRLLVGRPNPLEESAESVADTSGQQVLAIQDSKYFQNLYTLTLSLKRVRLLHSGECKAAAPIPQHRTSDEAPDSTSAIRTATSDKLEVPSSVIVTYIAVISPPLKTDELE